MPGTRQSSSGRLGRSSNAKTASNFNKAGYTASPVACGWAGAVFELLEHLGRNSEAKDRKNPKKVKCDGLTDGPTDRRTDQQSEV